MKVQEVIEMLTKYNEPDDDILIAWWDLNTYSDRVSKENWSKVVETLSNRNENYFGGVSESIEEVIQEIETEEEGETK